MATSCFIFCVLAAILINVAFSVKRQVKVQQWPDCSDYPSCQLAKNSSNPPNLVYVKAATPGHDNLYYAFSTLNAPTVIMAHTTGADAELKFNWDKLLNKSVTIDGAISFSNSKVQVHYKSGMMFTKLIEYDDIDDDADLTSCEKNKEVRWNPRLFNTFEWLLVEDAKEHEHAFIFNTTDDQLPVSESNNGSISFKFTIASSDGRSSELPRLKYFANETMFDFTVDNFTPSFNNSRYALETVVVSSLAIKEMQVEKTSTIDDEYAPGVFEITNLLSDPDNKAESSFMQWKPVCYFDKGRSRSTATKVKHYDLTNMSTMDAERSLVNKTLILALFGEKLWDDTNTIVRAMNISFGLPKDGYYVKNNFTAWTAALGYGTPPSDSISITVIAIISAGLGIPVVIIIVGGVYTIFRKTIKKGGYAPISGSVSPSEPLVN